MKILNFLAIFCFISIAAPALAEQPGDIVFLTTKTDIMGCYFKKGEESKARQNFKTSFSYGDTICMRAYTTGKIGTEVNMQDFHNNNFHKGYVFSWKHPDGDSGFWLVNQALAEMTPLPRGKHCVQMYVTGPDAQGKKPKDRRLAAKGCFNII